MWRKHRRRARPVFGITTAMLVLMPTPIGLQDIASLIARQPFVSERVRARLIASPFGTIHAATFNFTRPIGSDIPTVPGYTLASLDLREANVSGSIDASRVLGVIDVEPKRIFPTVNRAAKGDRLTPGEPSNAVIRSNAPSEPKSADGAVEDSGEPNAAPADMRNDDASHTELQNTEPAMISLPPDPVDNASRAGNEDASQPTDTEESKPEDGTPAFADENPVAMTARVYFGTAPLGGLALAIEPWAPGATPIVEPAYINDPDLKHFGRADDPMTAEPGETIAGKGEVTGAGKRPKSPAERLGLVGTARAKSEKCLTDAIYFEARGEVVTGQIAVAQVVLNRVFSGFYPSTVCGVVYQNAHRHLACQFTFACDGIPDRVTEPEAWTRAKEIARETLDGKLWLKQVGKSTHYHAYWVHPSWVREMMKMHRLGVHTFYRPRAWGDGAEAPVWGDPVATAEAAKNL
jgi:spore germination cell wall hydrolase CwlJ-like protein